MEAAPGTLISFRRWRHASTGPGAGARKVSQMRTSADGIGRGALQMASRGGGLRRLGGALLAHRLAGRSFRLASRTVRHAWRNAPFALVSPPLVGRKLRHAWRDNASPWRRLPLAWRTVHKPRATIRRHWRSVCHVLPPPASAKRTRPPVRRAVPLSSCNNNEAWLRGRRMCWTLSDVSTRGQSASSVDPQALAARRRRSPTSAAPAARLS